MISWKEVMTNYFVPCRISFRDTFVSFETGWLPLGHAIYIIELNERIPAANIDMKPLIFIGVSLSEPHTSGKNSTGVVFTKMYTEIRIDGKSIKRSQKFTFKDQVITYKCLQMCVHHANKYQSTLLTLHIRLVCMFITQKLPWQFTDT